jgi:hypothetical protein
VAVDIVEQVWLQSLRAAYMPVQHRTSTDESVETKVHAASSMAAIGELIHKWVDVMCEIARMRTLS